MILILTNKNDSHADEVIRKLAEQECEVFRLNTEDLLSDYNFCLSVDSRGSWSGTISDSTGRELDLKSLRTAWYRKPSYAINGIPSDVSDDAKEFISSEFSSLLDVIYSLPMVTWINDPFVADRSKVKYQQLNVARELGMRIPKTLITSNADYARAFLNEVGGECVVKSIYTANVTIHGQNRGLLTKKIDLSKFDEIANTLPICPTLFQEYCQKKYELRVVVIDRSVIAVKIESQLHSETEIDWRTKTLLNPHSYFELPLEVKDFCIEFMKRQGLIYGSMDFIVTPSEEYVFLENNPFGNYQWLDNVKNIDISQMMSDYIEEIELATLDTE